MGPIALFDKSFLQSLSVDEAVLFDHFFYPVISPLFFVETLADLEKAVREGRTPEQEVGNIAYKTPEMSGGPCAHHSRLAVASLRGYPVPMDGRIPFAGGRPVDVDGKQGIIFDAPAEARAFSRWQNGEFLEVERQFAHNWRASLAAMDLKVVAEGMKSFGITPQTCKSLEEAKRLADAVVSADGKHFDQMKIASFLFNIPRQYERPILERWSVAGYKPLSVYAPYAAHAVSVEVFFQITLAANLISSERSSNRVDVGYLFYLPFCMVFISSDKLHRRCAPIYLRSDQEFIWGEDLKADLKALNEYYSGVSDAEREKGIMSFASDPPKDGDFLVCQLWDRHLQPWRDRKPRVPLDPVQEKKLVDRLKRFTDAPTAQLGQLSSATDNVEMVSIERRVHKRRGSWWQVPKDLKEEDKSKS